MKEILISVYYASLFLIAVSVLLSLVLAAPHSMVAVLVVVTAVAVTHAIRTAGKRLR